ncbi:MAG: deaminase [Patescibacteria group bacterium]
MNVICVAYVPVLHDGYRRFFEKYKNATLFILGAEIIKEFTHLSKEIRQLEPTLVKKAVESWGIFRTVEILDLKTLKGFSRESGEKLNKKFGRKSGRTDVTFVMPDEDIMKELALKYLPKIKVTFDPIFLRWDKHKSMEEKPVQADQKISREAFDREIIKKLKIEAEKSSDWWRRIGAAIIKDEGMNKQKNGGKAEKIVLISHNEHLPSPHSPYAEGDPRNNFHKGVGIEYSTVLHAEAGLIAEAARKGISLDGASMYVSTFPCPMCAKLVAFSGIKKLYYAGGYSILDQERILKSQGVEIIFVEG